MSFFYNKKSNNFRTKPLWIFLFCIIVMIIPGIVLWLYFGYINLSHLYWIFPAGGVIVHGTYTHNLNYLNWILNNQHFKNSLYDNFIQAVKQIKHLLITSKTNTTTVQTIYLATLNKGVINPLISAIIVPLLMWSIFVPWVLKYTKLINYDTISFSFTSAGLISVLILSGAIPTGYIDNNTNTFINNSTWIILARIVIIAISIPILFFIADRIVFSILRFSHSASDLYYQLTEETIQIQNKQKTLKHKKDQFKQIQKEKEYVEIEKNQKTKKKDQK